MKKVFLLLFLILIILLTACVPDDIDREIKMLVKEVPIPARYSPYTGTQLLKSSVAVESCSYFESNYSKTTGKRITRYKIKLAQNNGTFSSEIISYLTLKVSDNSSLDGYYYQQNFSLEELKNNLHQMFWVEY